MGKDKIEKGEALLNDDRFNKLFNDKDFVIDKNSEHYLQQKTTAPQRNDDSSDGAQDSDGDSESDSVGAQNMAKHKPRNINNLFANKEDDSDDSAGD